MDLRLRPATLEDEPAVRAAHEQLAAEGFPFFGVPGISVDDPFADSLARLEALARGEAPPDLVPATFLLAELGGEVVGRGLVRHRLNDRLLAQGGHIGYAVLPAHRRRGIATEILRQCLVVARSVGVGRALLVCADANAASAAVIERCGGRLESVGPVADGRVLRRYWID